MKEFYKMKLEKRFLLILLLVIDEIDCLFFIGNGCFLSFMFNGWIFGYFMVNFMYCDVIYSEVF